MPVGRRTHVGSLSAFEMMYAVRGAMTMCACLVRFTLSRSNAETRFPMVSYDEGLKRVIVPTHRGNGGSATSVLAPGSANSVGETSMNFPHLEMVWRRSGSG